MIDKSKQNITLRVCLEDVGEHNKAILDFFFAKLGQHTFRRVDTQEDANVLIIDYDYPEARQRYEERYHNWHKPTIVLSVSPVELNDVIWLVKPLTSRALMDAAEAVQEHLKTPGMAAAPAKEAPVAAMETVVAAVDEPIAEPVVAPLLRPEIKPATEAPVNIPLVNDMGSRLDDTAANAPQESLGLSTQSHLSDEEQEARWQQLCGTLGDVEPTADTSVVQREDNFFLSSLRDAVRLARQCQQGVLLNFPQTPLYVLPEIHRIFCAIPIETEAFRTFVQLCNSHDGGKMHILSTSEIHELNDRIAEQASGLYDLESFVWTSSLLSTQGLLPRELDPHKQVGLRHWPSLTRLEQFPHVMPIAALWSVSANSAFEVASSLNVPQRYVFSFYNAAHALGLIEQDPDKLITKQSTSRTTEAPRGLFSRLLKRLIGG